MSLFARPPAPRSRRSTREPVVPMINVVFLLLIFFLMSAQLTTPAPFEIALPEAAADEAEGRHDLYLSSGGEIAWRDLRGAAALEAAAALPEPVLLHADAGLDAARLARLLARLAALGARDVTLMTGGP